MHVCFKAAYPEHSLPLDRSVYTGTGRFVNPVNFLIWFNVMRWSATSAKTMLGGHLSGRSMFHGIRDSKLGTGNGKMLSFAQVDT